MDNQVRGPAGCTGPEGAIGPTGQPGVKVEVIDGRKIYTKTLEDGTTFSWVPNPMFDGDATMYQELVKAKARRKGITNLPWYAKEDIPWWKRLLRRWMGIRD